MSNPQSNPLQLPLQGIRVLDVSQVMAGPFACMLLADLGADVIKVEPPGTGDQTRGAMGFKMKGPDSMGFLNMNRNKRSLTLDLKSEEDRKSTRLNSSHGYISYAVFCLKKKKNTEQTFRRGRDKRKRRSQRRPRW